MAKDWVGGSAAVFKTLGASNHTDADSIGRIIMPLSRRLRNGFASWSGLRADIGAFVRRGPHEPSAGGSRV